MFDKVKGIISLVMLANRQEKSAGLTELAVLERRCSMLRAELTLYKDIGKSRYEQNEPLKAKIKALEAQNGYLRGTNDLMRETIEAQTEVLKSQSTPSEAENKAPFKVTCNSSSFDSKNS